MTASDLYSQSLSSLVATRKSMLSPAWQNSLDGKSADLKAAASLDLIQVQMAISALSNAALSDIANQMTDQSQALQDATGALNDALKDLTKAQNVISGITTLLNIVSKIVPLI